MPNRVTCNVRIYDHQCAPLHALVHVFLFEQGGIYVLDDGKTGPIPGEDPYGVSLAFRLKNPTPITVIVDDDKLMYSGNIYLNLNGTISSRFDLVLLKLPDSPGHFPRFGGPTYGTGARSALHGLQTLYSSIDNQRRWTAPEKKAVRNLIASVTSFAAPGLPPAGVKSPAIQRIINNWSDALARLRVPVETQVAAGEPAFAHFRTPAGTL